MINRKPRVIKLILIGLGVIILGIAISFIIGRVRETAIVNRMEAMLLDQHCLPYVEVVDFNSFSDLPPPVARYFKHVLVDGQKLIEIAKMHQWGMLRTNMKNDTWSSFTAHQIIVPPAGFIWNAKVGMPLGAHVRVLDSYCAGEGAGRVTILSAFPVASVAGDPELNSGALHRYLAEAVWYPTALLPQSGVVWNPIDDRSATATLTDSGITVSLEFRFNDADEVVAIYSSGRFGRFAGEYKQVPWEGHFRDYQIREGMRIPMYGEVGWYEDETLNLVWKGDLLEVQYQLGY